MAKIVPGGIIDTWDGVTSLTFSIGALVISPRLKGFYAAAISSEFL
jgi:hypothetical protein